MRKDDPKIQRQRYDNAHMTYRNGQFTNEFGQMEDLGFGSAHPTGREKAQTYEHYQHPFCVKMRAMFDRQAINIAKKKEEIRKRNENC